MDVNDVMNAFFGGGGHGMGATRGGGRARSRDDVRRLSVTLEDLYMGKEFSVNNTRNVACSTCKGRGVKPGAPQATCRLCQGSGARVIVQQMGMMVQQMRTVCDGCGGTGERVDPRNQCPACRGQKTVAVEETISVAVKKGMTHKQQISFPGKASCEPGASAAGDLIFLLDQEKHSQFVRKECDLYMLHRISLAEALCGFQLKLRHLDGRELVARRARGEITRPGDVQCITGEGMPIAGQENRFGDLIVEFEVLYPDMLSESQVDALRTALSAPAQPQRPQEEGTICYLSKDSIETLEREIQKDDMENEEAESADGGGQPGCAAQ